MTIKRFLFSGGAESLELPEGWIPITVESTDGWTLVWAYTYRATPPQGQGVINAHANERDARMCDHAYCCQGCEDGACCHGGTRLELTIRGRYPDDNDPED